MIFSEPSILAEVVATSNMLQPCVQGYVWFVVRNCVCILKVSPSLSNQYGAGQEGQKFARRLHDRQLGASSMQNGILDRPIKSYSSFLPLGGILWFSCLGRALVLQVKKTLPWQEYSFKYSKYSKQVVHNYIPPWSTVSSIEACQGTITTDYHYLSSSVFTSLLGWTATPAAQDPSSTSVQSTVLSVTWPLPVPCLAEPLERLEVLFLMYQIIIEYQPDMKQTHFWRSSWDILRHQVLRLRQSSLSIVQPLDSLVLFRVWIPMLIPRTRNTTTMWPS